MMQSFHLLLSNGAMLTGIHNIPPHRPPIKYRPLMIGLHGSTYDCHYFDADANQTAGVASAAFGVPFVSINRPCYGGKQLSLASP